MKRLLLASSATVSVLLAGAAYAQQPKPIVNAATPAPECSANVNYDRNALMPGYLKPTGDRQTCIPFMPTNQLVPAGYAGTDFYTEEFSDAKIRERWAACRKDPACAEPVNAGAKGFVAYEKRDTGMVGSGRPFDPEGDVDLKTIRRPAFFGNELYREPIAEAEARTFTVEFTVPRDGYERLHLKKEDPIRLRGWYLEGTGVADGSGRTIRALVVMNNGGGGEITAIDDPRSPGAVYDEATRKWIAGKFPDAMTEESGNRHWRGFIYALNRAGFDVLVSDRRGNGVSGGVSGYNTAEQANDVFRQLTQLETGEGLRLLTPDGAVLAGSGAAGRLLAGQKANEIPTVVGGYSRGSYTTAWTMHKNFVEDCNYDVADAGCKPPRGWTNLKGAILYGPNSAGLGYRQAGHDLIEASLRGDYNTTYYPDGKVLANVGRWPGLLVVKGTWDYVEGLEGSLDAYRRAQEPKDIFVFRGPHQLNTQSPDNMRLAGERMVAFARAAVLGGKQVEGALHPADLKALVVSSPDFWETTTAPKD